MSKHQHHRIIVQIEENEADLVMVMAVMIR